LKRNGLSYNYMRRLQERSCSEMMTIQEAYQQCNDILISLEDTFLEMPNYWALRQLMRHKHVLGNVQRVTVKRLPKRLPGCHFHKPGDQGHTVVINSSNRYGEELLTLLHEAVELKAQSLKKCLTRGRTFKLSKQTHQAVEGCANLGAPLITELLCCLGPLGLCL
jgi:hypothetical protein